MKLKPNTYQPNKAELEEDLRVKSSFDNAVKSLVTPVEVKREVRLMKKFLTISVAVIFVILSGTATASPKWGAFLRVNPTPDGDGEYAYAVSWNNTSRQEALRSVTKACEQEIGRKCWPAYEVYEYDWWRNIPTLIIFFSLASNNDNYNYENTETWEERFRCAAVYLDTHINFYHAEFGNSESQTRKIAEEAIEAMYEEQSDWIFDHGVGRDHIPIDLVGVYCNSE